MKQKIKGTLLPLLSVNRPVTVVMVLLCALVLGGIGYYRISLQLLPTGMLDNPRLWINAGYGATANPREVEKQLTRPLEEMLRTVRGITTIRSFSHASGCNLNLEFDQDVDMKIAFAQVRDRIERTRPELPETVRQINIWKWNEGDIPIVYFTITLPENADDAYYLVENKIKRAIERIDGVAKAEFWGLEEKQIYIDLNRQRLQSLGVDIYRLVGRLRQDNFVLSSGRLEDSSTRYIVRSMARFPNIESIQELPIGVRGLRLKDVAQVSYRPSDRQWLMRTDHKPSIGAQVSKESMANTVDVCRAVTRLLEEEIPRQKGMEDVKFTIHFNQGYWIVDSVNNIQQTCLWGGLFAVLILLYFLRSYRMTGIITLAIPLTLLFTVIVMYFLDWSLNLVTMMGMMISIGMVVDNSIVVVENIYRMRQGGLGSRQAAVDGASQVSLAITMSTMTTVVVFLPLILMNKGESFILLRLGLPVMVALLASLLVALFFIPLGTIKISPKEHVKERRILSWLNQRYQVVLRWTLTHRLETSIILVVLLASSFYPQRNLKKDAWKERERDEIYINCQLPEYSTWERSQRLFSKIEEFLYERQSRYGFETISVRHGRIWGTVEMYRPLPKRQWYEIGYRNLRKKLGSPVDSGLAYTEILKELNDSLPKFPDTKVRVNWQDNSQQDPTISIFIYGDDTGTLIDLAEGVKRRLAGIPGMVGVDTETETGENELRVLIDRNRARQHGLDSRRIASTVAYGGSGMRLNEFRTSEKEIKIYLQFADMDSTTLHTLRNTPVYSDSGRSVPLGTVARFQMEKGPGQIRRKDGKTYLSVRGTTTKEDMKDTFGAVDKAMDGFEMPRGYSWDKGDQFWRRQQQEEAEKFGIYMAIIFVFLLMGVLFESFALPLSVVIAIPFSFFGAWWVLFLTGTAFDELCGIGLIILVGVVVNNAIVLVDMIQHCRASGMDRMSALIEAGRNRFRPILMTAATTIGGLVPMAVGGARFADMSYAPMGRTMMGGLITSTLVTLVAVPLLYTFFDDLRGLGKRIMTAFFTRSRGESPRE